MVLIVKVYSEDNEAPSSFVYDDNFCSPERALQFAIDAKAHSKNIKVFKNVKPSVEIQFYTKEEYTELCHK